LASRLKEKTLGGILIFVDGSRRDSYEGTTIIIGDSRNHRKIPTFEESLKGQGRLNFMRVTKKSLT